MTQNGIKKLFALSAKHEKHVIGLMSGTSVDGIDAALVKITGNYIDTKIEEIAFENFPFPRGVREEIFKLFDPETSSSRDICNMNFRLGELFAEAAIGIAEKAKISLEEIDLIGSHGQTIYHMPETLSTLQIGEGGVIAHKTGIITVSDFRTADMAAGGLGAPLVPYTEFLLYANKGSSETIALQNIGGIGNITVIPPNADADDIIAFDTGPGNMVIDYLAEKITGLPFDKNGAIAEAGVVNHDLLEHFLKDEYISAPPPKTTGREYFGKDFSEGFYDMGKASQLSDQDIIATATAFTAETISYSVKAVATFKHLNHCPVQKLIIGGGGAYNKQLVKMISNRLPGITVTTQEAAGKSSDSKEAVAFAILANETISGNTSNLPRVTGARCGKILGKINLA